MFCLCRILEIKWHERDYKYLQEAALWDENVRGALSHCGLLNFMWIPLMKSLHLLLQTLVSFWDIREDAFMIQG